VLPHAIFVYYAFLHRIFVTAITTMTTPSEFTHNAGCRKESGGHPGMSVVCIVVSKKNC
jgi:hypothetical protein